MTDPNKMRSVYVPITWGDLDVLHEWGRELGHRDVHSFLTYLLKQAADGHRRRKKRRAKQALAEEAPFA